MPQVKHLNYKLITAVDNVKRIRYSIHDVYCSQVIKFRDLIKVKSILLLYIRMNQTTFVFVSHSDLRTEGREFNAQFS